jgi:hypothetical protein
VACPAHIDAPTGVRKADINMGLRGLSVSHLPMGEESRAAVTVQSLSMLAISLSEKFSVRPCRPGSDRHILRPTGPAGDQQEWTLFSLGLGHWSGSSPR